MKRAFLPGILLSFLLVLCNIGQRVHGYNSGTAWRNNAAFAALKSDVSVATWGSPSHGGDSSSVSGSLASGVSVIYSTEGAFAALKSDGSVVHRLMNLVPLA